MSPVRSQDSCFQRAAWKDHLIPVLM
uniref:Uncharacterized protein n=1 Tax=Anguilla anguilla TaxID=7936 RepID=A0A0E9S7B2_ANGAN